MMIVHLVIETLTTWDSGIPMETVCIVASYATAEAAENDRIYREVQSDADYTYSTEEISVQGLEVAMS